MRGSISKTTLVLVLALAFTLDASTAFLQGSRSQWIVGGRPWVRYQTNLFAGNSQDLGVPSLIPAPPSVSTTTSSVTSTDPKTGATTTVVTTVTTITAPAGSLDSNPSSPATTMPAIASATTPTSAMAQSIANLPDYGDENIDEATAAMKNMLAMSQMMGENSESARSEYESEEEELLAQGGELWFLEDGSEDTSTNSPLEQSSSGPADSDGAAKVVQYDEYGDPLDDDDDVGPSSADAMAAMEAIARAKSTGAAFEKASGVNAEEAREALRIRMRSQGTANGSIGNSDPKRFQDTEDDVIEMGGDPWFLSDEPVKQ